MAFFAKVAAGGLTAGALITYYHIDINATTTHLTRELRQLSEQLVQTSPESTSSPLVRTFPQPIPERIGLSESIKARWNESLQSGLSAARETEWTSAISNTWTNAKNGVSGLGSYLRNKVAPVAEDVTNEIDPNKKLV